MTTAFQQVGSISLFAFLLQLIVSLYLPLQAQANPSNHLQATPTAEALLPLQTKTTSSEDELQVNTVDSKQSVTAQQVSPDQPLLADQQPINQQPPTDQQSPTDQKSKSQKKSHRINYFGLGGNIGLINDGGTAIGSGGFTVLGRKSLTNNLSIHTTSVFGDKSIQSTALTGGIPIKSKATGRTILFPFVGAGASIKINNFTVYPMVTAGLDIPITNYLTGTMRMNTTFAERTDVGFVMGVGVDIFGLLFKRK
jgi:hypothetical protein